MLGLTSSPGGVLVVGAGADGTGGCRPTRACSWLRASNIPSGQSSAVRWGIGGLRPYLFVDRYWVVRSRSWPVRSLCAGGNPTNTGFNHLMVPYLLLKSGWGTAGFFLNHYKALDFYSQVEMGLGSAIRYFHNEKLWFCLLTASRQGGSEHVHLIKYIFACFMFVGTGTVHKTKTRVFSMLFVKKFFIVFWL